MKRLMWIVLISLTSFRPNTAGALNKNPATNFMSGKYGVMISYSASNKTVDAGNLNIAEWNAYVNQFDVSHFVSQIQMSGAAYVVFMLGQNNGFYIGPNQTYELLAHVGPGLRMSHRDLIAELGVALHAANIRLVLYLPSNAPQRDTHAANALGFVDNRCGDWCVTEEGTTHWASVIQDWSDHYGSLVSGWWFDGYYPDSGFTTNAAAQKYTDAVHHGNPDAVSCFNFGEAKINNPNAIPEEDYTCGEARKVGRVPRYSPPHSRWFNNGTSLEQWATTFPLAQGHKWGQEIADSEFLSVAKEYKDKDLIEWLKSVMSAGGTAILDVKIDWTGTISPHIYQQLKAIRAGVDGSKFRRIRTHNFE